MSSRQRIPIAAYRLQFNREFRFEDACSLVPYLNKLGISDIYASPILQARRGSTHGYDVTDPTRLNPELGPDKDYNALVNALQKHGMELLLDIVPNHMSASPENPWWWDVVDKSQDSPYFSYFDINWLDFHGVRDVSTDYRRFFDVSELVGMRVEDPQVFEVTHRLIINLINEGKITGLRIDHIDGLYDPLEYLKRLQQQFPPSVNSPGIYLVVEKILSGDEALSENWPVSGTTGYDFAGTLNTLFIDRKGIERLRVIYSQLSGSENSLHEVVYEKKKQVMCELFPGEIDALGQWLAGLSDHLAIPEAKDTLIEMTACLPVYRTYTRNMEVKVGDRQIIEIAVKEAIRHRSCPEVALSFLRRVLLLDFPPGLSPEDGYEWLEFVMRWQQLTGAIMAKGFEDTTLYNYHCLISLNEVGGRPDTIGLSVQDFHRWNSNRMKYWPHTINTTSTHDTKRSEDVRARINVLSELPDEWEEQLMRWCRYNMGEKRKSRGLPVPEPNIEMLLYQTLIGAWPLYVEEISDFHERLKAYMIKAVREAKTITNWIKVNQEYEDDLLGFIGSILEDSVENEFLHDFQKFQGKIAWYGALNSLSQVLLKITSPGVPDFYQGTDLWDFSLVDPDNRRRVDFKKREKLLDAMVREKPAIGDILASWQDGRIKLYVTYKALNMRKKYRRLFREGEYVPLKVEGESKKHVCAFARNYGSQWVLTIVPRFFTKLAETGEFPLGIKTWQDDCVLLPRSSPQQWENVFTGETIEIFGAGKTIHLADVFRTFPVTLLVPSV